MVKRAYQTNGKPTNGSRIIKTEVVCPNDTNPMGILQGGRLVQWMDIGAAVCAQNYAGSVCVTASIERINFMHPARVGDILLIEAEVNQAFRTSMVISVKAWASTIGQKGSRLISDSDFVFVAISTNGKPSPLPKFKQGLQAVGKTKRV